MNTFVLEIWEDTCDLCTFYSVKLEGAKENETDKFFLEYENNPEFLDDLNKLMSLLIIQIGNEHGAIEPFFNRQENLATALPPKKENFFYKHKIHEIYLENSLRLLCYKVNEEIVILFNGGIKTGRTYQESPELSLHFYEAQGYVKKISQAIQDGFININNRQLEDYTGSTEIEL